MPLYHTHTDTQTRSQKCKKSSAWAWVCLAKELVCMMSAGRHTHTHTDSCTVTIWCETHTHTLWSMRTCEAPLPISHAPRSLPHRNVASFSRVTWPLVASSGAPILYSSLWHKALNAVGIHWAATTLTPLTDIVDDIDPQWNVCLWHFTGQYSDKAPHHVPNT